jgi:hypothetical protein
VYVGKTLISTVLLFLNYCLDTIEIMNIGIDAREIQNGVFTGIGRVLHIFLSYFADLKDENKIILFSETKLPYDYGPRVVSKIIPASALRVYWDQVILSRCINQYSIDLFYSPYYKIPLAAKVPIISTIFDLMYIYYPVQWKGNGLFTKLHYQFFGKMMALKANTIFTCSTYSKSEIMRFYNIDENKIKTIIHKS